MLNEVMRAEEWHGTTVSEQCCWLLLCKTKEEMWSMTPPCPFYCKNHQASIMVWYWPTVLFLKQMDLTEDIIHTAKLPEIICCVS